MASTYLEKVVPSLEGWDVDITSDPSFEYNCIAWAAGDQTRVWWPVQGATNDTAAYWPEGVAREETLAAFAQAYATLGYEECADGSYDPDHEKIAVHVDVNGVPTHASRQLDKNFWTSKLGGYHDVRHLLEAMEDEYGRVALIMKRRRRTSSTASPVPDGGA